MISKLLSSCCLALLLILVPPVLAGETAKPVTAAEASAYTLTVIPFYSPEKIWARFSPFVDFLKETTGKPWQLKLYPSHEALIDGFCRGESTLALLGPVPLGRVMDKCGAEPLVVALGKDGKPFYHSVVVTNDTAVTSLAGLRGKRVAFFKGSTAAHILPRQMLRQAGLGKGTFSAVFYEGQDQIVNALLAREVSAAGLKDTLYRKFQGEALHVLKTSEALPNFAFAAAPGLDRETRQLFADTVLRLAPATNDQDRKRMEPWDDEIRNGFILPPEGFQTSLRLLMAITKELMREDR